MTVIMCVLIVCVCVCVCVSSCARDHALLMLRLKSSLNNECVRGAGVCVCARARPERMLSVPEV